MDNARQGGKGLTMARQSGGRQHNKRRGRRTQCRAIGRLMAQQEGGGQTTNACWWLTASGSGGRGCTQDVLEIVPQNCTSNCAKKTLENWIF